MQQEPQISYHGLDSSPSLDAEIRARIAELDEIYDGLVGVRVSIEALHNQHRTGNLYECHITLMVPGPDINVSKPPNKAKDKYHNPDVYTSVRESFSNAVRQLRNYKAKQAGGVKYHEPLFQGQVAEMHADQDYGYVLTAEGSLLYFNRAAVISGDFDQYQRGDVVHYIAGEGEAGPSAIKIWRGSEHDIDKMA